MNEQNGYAVEVYADAPMRVRAWFEDADEAHAYAAQHGGPDATRVYAAPMVAGDALDALRADAADHSAEMRALLRDLDTARAEAESARVDADHAHRECARLRSEAA